MYRKQAIILEIIETHISDKRFFITYFQRMYDKIEILYEYENVHVCMHVYVHVKLVYSVNYLKNGYFKGKIGEY